MIFVPCKDGISHNEAEYSSKEQCAAGAQVLLQAVLDYDRQSGRALRREIAALRAGRGVARVQRHGDQRRCRRTSC